MGRKPVPEHEKKKERRLYLTDAEWEALQAVRASISESGYWSPEEHEAAECILASIPSIPVVSTPAQLGPITPATPFTFDPDAEGVG